MFRLTTFLLIILFGACQSGNNSDPLSPADKALEESLMKHYKPTKLPIRIESINDAKRNLIKDSHDSDTSSYLMNTRPIVFQIQGVGNNKDEVRYTQPINRPFETMIYALAEARDTQLLDYGWIENEAGDTVWENGVLQK